MSAFVVLAFALLGGAAAAVVQPRAASSDPEQELYKLPAGLRIGAGLSSSQFEGAWQDGGKSESVLDHLAHLPKSPFPANIDVAADHYHRYKEDLAFAKEMKFTSHRFSISWCRIFPDGNASKPNEVGVKFYSDYIDEIKKNGMEPLVTMYHFDHPYALEKRVGGWGQPAMVDEFLKYADFLFRQYGERVKYWNPVNEGNMLCIFLLTRLNTYNITKTDDSSYYNCIHHTILAQARTYRLYKKSYFQKQQGLVGTSVLVWPGTPATDNYEDVMAANTFNDVFGSTPVHPLVYGEYPETAKFLIKQRSEDMGMKKSRLPSITSDEREILIGKDGQGGPSTDFIALNVYAGYKIHYEKNANNTIPTAAILRPPLDDMPFVKISGGDFNKIDPTLMKTALLWAWNSYHLPIVITENGFGDYNHEGVQDIDREAYYSANLRTLVRTANEFGVPLISYHAWSLVDGFEFSSGYEKRPFGLVTVDYKNKTLNRKIKESSKLFIDIAKTGYVPEVNLPPTSGSASRSVAQLGFILLVTQLFVTVSSISL